MNQLFRKTGIIFIFAFAPFVSSAATFASSVTIINGLIGKAIAVVIALSVATFLWGMAQLISSHDNKDKTKKAKEFITYGIISLFVMVSVWGIVKILTDTFGVTQKIPVTIQTRSFE